jgi:chemotaxis protein CheD
VTLQQKPTELRIGIADYKISQAPNNLITVGLGSCIGTLIYDERSGIGGLSHIMLPDSRPFEKRTTVNAAKFANLALPKMVDEMKRQIRFPHFKAKIVGGANMFNFDNNTQNVGARNIMAVEETLKQLRIPIIAKHVGGSNGQTMVADLETFQVMVRIVHQETVYL